MMESLSMVNTTAEAPVSGFNMNESWTQSAINNSYTNGSLPKGNQSYLPDAGGPPALQSPSYVLLATDLSICIPSVCMNIFVFCAISKAKPYSPAAGPFLQNCATSNIILSLFHIVDLPFLLHLFKTPNTCATALFFTLLDVALFSQTMAIVCLTLDRIYAVAHPIHYRTVGYNKSVKIGFLVMPWVVAIFIESMASLKSFVKMLSSNQGIQLLCDNVDVESKLTGNASLVNYVLIGSHTLAFMIYIAAYFILKYQKNRIKNNTYLTPVKTALSLVMTYFLINFTTLCLYLPMPIYSVVRSDIMSDPSKRQEHLVVTRSLLILYSCNFFLTPWILILRIPAIRQKLPCRSIKKKENPAVSYQESISCIVTEI